MKNKVFKILPIVVILSILITILDIFIEVDYSNRILSYVLNLDYTLLSMSVSLLIYAYLSDKEEYQWISKLGIFVTILNFVLSFVLVVMRAKSLAINSWEILDNIKTISSNFSSCLKYCSILLIIGALNEKANSYRGLAIKTELILFVCRTITNFIDLDSTWTSRISGVYSIMNGCFYLFTILFLIENGKDKIEQSQMQTPEVSYNQVAYNNQQMMYQNNQMMNNNQQVLNQNNPQQ